jgi:hypothetical protein
VIKEKVQIRPEHEELEGEEEYEVERILQSEVLTNRRMIGRRCMSNKSFYFLVQWKCYPDDESTWEPGTSLKLARETSEEFYEENPKAPAIMT